MSATSTETYHDLYFRIRDGHRLHARLYPAQGSEAGSKATPVVCLAGLTRNGRDFHDVAVYLSQHASTPRDVYTFDYRGRGHSDWDSDWKNYAVPIEALDVVDFLAFAGLHEIIVMGTSRGGMVSMFLAAMQPAVLRGVILNDIGPVIEVDGLMRIAGYVGRVPLPRTWDEATDIARDVNKRTFPGVQSDVWAEVARQWYNEKEGRPSPGYDPELKNSLSVLDGPMPTLWPQFEALGKVPMLVLRGEHSDILSVATVEEMRRRHPSLEDFTVPGQGHAPLLKDRETQSVIGGFLERTDQAGHGAGKAQAAKQPGLRAISA